MFKREPVNILSEEACKDRYEAYLEACEEDKLPTYQELLDEIDEKR